MYSYNNYPVGAPSLEQVERGDHWDDTVVTETPCIPAGVTQ